ncbi:MAG: GerMN domain-containing protein [Clostridia bacterium]|nr:GerMN domain-containing protein [Clostridia bacterium]
MKRFRFRFLCILMAVLLPLLSACGSQSMVNSDTQTGSTLPPVQNPYTAPTDDSGLTSDSLVNQYLPSRDGQKLLARQATVSLHRSGGNARTLVQALLSAREDSLTDALGRKTELQLYGVMPVEVSGNVCTVNLAGSTMALENDEIYAIGLSLASTLAEGTNIRYVNVLIADVPYSYNNINSLPAGSVSAHPGEDLPVLWEQLRTRGAESSAEARSKSLSATATLYFPLADRSGFVAEARNLTFSGQSPDMLAKGLLMALSAGPQVVTGCAELPDINGMLLLQPTVSNLDEGGLLVTLQFSEDLQEVLEDYGVDFASFVASVNWTLSTFIPSVRAVRFFTGSTMLTALYGEPYGALSIEKGLTRRSFFKDGLRDQDQIALVKNGRLTSVSRSLSSDAAGDPRTLLELMLQGATQEETTSSLSSPLPQGLDSSDIIGIGTENGTLLLNLSSRFADRIASMDEDAQRLCCYAMVNCLCDTLQLTRVRFYWNSEVRGEMGTRFDWSGEFMLNHSLTDP